MCAPECVHSGPRSGAVADAVSWLCPGCCWNLAMGSGASGALILHRLGGLHRASGPDLGVCWGGGLWNCGSPRIQRHSQSRCLPCYQQAQGTVQTAYLILSMLLAVSLLRDYSLGRKVSRMQVLLPSKLASLGGKINPILSNEVLRSVRHSQFWVSA